MSKGTPLEYNAVNSNAPVDFLIITALQDELDAVMLQLTESIKIQHGDFPTYYLAILKSDSGFNQEKLVVAVTLLGGMGNIPAAIRATQCIQRLSPRFVVFVGIAGGIKGKVYLGDVVVSNQVIYYEYAKATPSGSEPRMRDGAVDSLLLDRAMNYDGGWVSLIHAKRPTTPNSTQTPQVHFAPIASGEKVIADDEFVRDLGRKHSRFYAIEMESFGVAAAAADSDTRPGFIAVRGVSDYADDSKNDVWRKYAAETAAAFTIGFLQSSSFPVRDFRPPPIRKALIAIHHHSMESLPKRLNEAMLPEVFRPTKLTHIEINQTDLYDNGTLTDPVIAARRQIDIMPKLSKVLSDDPDSELCYCGIAHIPLLFHMGCQVLNRVPMHFFEHNRVTKQWDVLQRADQFPQIEFDGLPDVATQKAGDIVVRISISYFVTPESIKSVVTNPIESVHLSIDSPERDVVISKNQLEQYSMVFRDMLDEIHKKIPNTELIHIFYAGPVALAVDFGRQISKTIHPRIIVYNYSRKDNPPGYAWGLEVTADVDYPDFMIKTRR